MTTTWDRLLALAVLVAVVVELLLRPDAWDRAAVLVCGLALAVAVLWRRRRPLAAVVLGFGVLAALDLATLAAARDPVLVWTGAAVLLLPVALARWGGPTQLVAGATVVVAVWALSVARDPSGLTDALGGLVVLALAGALGGLARYRATALEAGTARARAQEREQLARELHDTVAHHVSGIAVQAQAGQALVAGGDLSATTATLRRIEVEASLTLKEMRGLVGALRRHDGSHADPVPRGLADLQDLTHAGGDGRPRVEVSVSVGEVPPAVGATVYRVAQEAVTNAQRHARDARLVRVRVSELDESVRVQVVDDGRQAPLGLRRPGYGLVGMAERVALLDGTLEAGPVDEHGWTVEATLPRTAGPS